MRPHFRRILRVLAGMLLMWAVARAIFLFVPGQDGVAACVLLFCVLAVATAGDRTLALLTSLSASLSFSYYFVDTYESLRITTTEGTVSFVAMVFTALTGSHLALRAQRRASEAERRRSEMEQLQQLGTALLAPGTLRDAAQKAVIEIVACFGGGAILYVAGCERPFRSGDISSTHNRVIHQVNQNVRLELIGMEPSVEVQSALVNVIGLVLDRAAAAEERARIEAAQRGEELRNTVLNALAHNFRTPLTCIKAAASMMRGSEAEGTPASYSAELVEVIDEEADRLDALIRDSLGLARIQSRQANPRFEPSSIASMISGVLEKMRRYLARQIIIVDIPEELPPVRCDRFLFEQMVTQVLDNAWKYSGAGARLWISAQSSGPDITLTVKNEGSRIPEEEVGLIFDRFYRGARNRVTVEGTGLGLAIAKTIAEAHGGRVWLDNEPEGPAFRFAFPAGTPEEQNDREPHYIAD